MVKLKRAEYLGKNTDHNCQSPFCRHKTYFNNFFMYLKFKLKVHLQVINGQNLWKPWAKLNLNSLCYEKGTMFRITITKCQINCEKLDWSSTESAHVVPFFNSNMKYWECSGFCISLIPSADPQLSWMTVDLVSFYGSIISVSFNDKEQLTEVGYV